MHKIGTIAWSAPLWRGASLEELNVIIDHLSSASYHFADDSSKEWHLGQQSLNKAAKEINSLKLGYTAITALYAHKAQLIGFDQFVDAILKDARK